MYDLIKQLLPFLIENGFKIDEQGTALSHRDLIEISTNALIAALQPHYQKAFDAKIAELKKAKKEYSKKK